MNVRPVILIIDDDKFIRAQLKAFLVKRQLDIIEAEDGKTALEIIKRDKPDLVLLDLVMPGMSGEDVLVQIRNKHKAEELPVIIVTADKGQMTIYKIKLLGSQNYISKPFNEACVISKIESTLDIKLPPVTFFDECSTDVYSDDKILNHQALFDACFTSLVANFLIIHNFTNNDNPFPGVLDVVTEHKKDLDKIIHVRGCKNKVMQKIIQKPDIEPKDVLKQYISLAYEECKRISKNDILLGKIKNINISS